MRAAARSPYLLGVCSYVLMLGATSTFAYYIQADVVNAASDDSDARTRIFARLDFWSNALALILQLFVVGRLLPRLGPGVVLAICRCSVGWVSWCWGRV